MRILRWDPPDGDGWQACHEVFLAAGRADDPEAPPMMAKAFRGWLAAGWGGDPREVWFVPGETEGTASAWYRLVFPDLENQDRAGLVLVVRPDRRRHGLGRALLRHAMGRAAEHGRSVMDGGALDGTSGEAFARAAGAIRGLTEERRVLDLGKIPEGRIGQLRGEAERAAAGYSLVSWTGLVPGEFLGQVAGVLNAFQDAPHEEGVQPEIWDAQRVRERINDLYPIFATEVYSIAARHDATGTLAALTQMVVDPAGPDWGYQAITAVVRTHRGHRLGLLTKAAMLEWLATAEPQMQRIVTGNSATNKHMIAINETLGFELLGPATTSWELRVEAPSVQ
ncbi:MAG: GNAT family N-acetyltransferase [Streptosporangiaceae bacterium]|nr:GNAT family N-acetyltransferase [Streptosporangiaceae bacterium]MBV9854742.1 GNAT family N-acetyltransferase [Streptosporangiaceae bacterium]